MADWNMAAEILEFLVEPLPEKRYDKALKPEDITWIKHHLALAKMNPAMDVVEFTKQFMHVDAPKRVAALKKAAPTYCELEKKYAARRKRSTRLRGCFCAIQDYCDVCEEH